MYYADLHLMVCTFRNFEKKIIKLGLQASTLTLDNTYLVELDHVFFLLHTICFSTGPTSVKIALNDKSVNLDPGIASPVLKGNS